MNNATSNANIYDTFKRTLNKLRATKINLYQKDHLMRQLEDLAFEDPSCKEGIVETIRAYVDTVDLETKILLIDLIYLIISSPRRNGYNNHFNEHIVDIFFSAYIRAGRIARDKLFEKREQWDSYFPKKVLKELDDTIRRADPTYPIVPERSDLIAKHKERIALLREVNILRAERDRMKAEWEICEPVSVAKISKPNPADEKIIPIQKTPATPMKSAHVPPKVNAPAALAAKEVFELPIALSQTLKSNSIENRPKIKIINSRKKIKIIESIAAPPNLLDSLINGMGKLPDEFR